MRRLEERKNRQPFVAWLSSLEDGRKGKRELRSLRRVLVANAASRKSKLAISEHQHQG